MPRLTVAQRARAHGLLEAGLSIRDVAERFGVSRPTIRQVQRRFNETGAFDDRPRSGRPRVTTERQDRYMILSHLRDRFRTATTTARGTIGKHGRLISHDTVGRRLNAAQLRARRPPHRPILNAIRRQNRVEWARQRMRWTRRRWASVLFSDESRFCLSVADGRRRVWRRRGERHSQNCILEFDRWGGANVMVWAGMSSNHRTQLVVLDANLTAQLYIDQILTPHVVPTLEAQ